MACKGSELGACGSVRRAVGYGSKLGTPRSAAVTAVASSSGSAPASSSASAKVLTPSRGEASARCSASPNLFSARRGWSNSLVWSSSVRIE